MSEPCPCGSARNFEQCCGALISGERQAETAEQLMRSRYTAYVCRARDYLLSTWHPSTRPPTLHLETDPPTQWIGLKVLATRAGGLADNEGRVEFIARYKLNGRAARLQENSRFRREQGRWYYLDGGTDQ